MKTRWMGVLLFPIVAVAQQFTPQSSTPRFVGDLAGITYFAATDATAGRELWRTDGTPQGTYRVIDLIPGTGGFLNLAPVGAVDGKLIVVGITSSLEQSLYATDGTTGGTREIASQQSIRSQGVVYRGAMYYLNGTRLWRTDGTTAGTRDTAIGSYEVLKLAIFGDALYLIAVSLDRVSLLRTDGTAAGTQIVHTFSDVGFVKLAGAATLSPLDDRVIFSVYSDPARQTELWSSDGTSAGTQKLAAFDDPLLDVGPLWAAGDRLFFRGIDAEHGEELWVTDGTGAGTRLLGDLFAGARGSFPEARAVSDDRLFFRAADGFWVLHRTTLEVRRLVQYTAWQDRAAAWDGRVVFTLQDISRGAEPWWTDGSVEGTRPIADVNRGPGNGVAVEPITLFARELATTAMGVLFVGNDGLHGDELWITDGTAAGTRLVKDIHTGLVAELDTDGVSAATENGAPNNGDGDADGTRDSESSLTASMRTRTREYVTVKASCPIEQARLLSQSALTPRGGIFRDSEIAEFQLRCASAEVTIIYSGLIQTSTKMRYLTYAPLLPGTAAWFILNDATVTLPEAGFGRAVVRMPLTDGGPGDDSPAGDGLIVHRGGLGERFGGPRNRAGGK